MIYNKFLGMVFEDLACTDILTDVEYRELIELFGEVSDYRIKGYVAGDDDPTAEFEEQRYDNSWYSVTSKEDDKLLFEFRYHHEKLVEFQYNCDVFLRDKKEFQNFKKFIMRNSLVNYNYFKDNGYDDSDWDEYWDSYGKGGDRIVPKKKVVYTEVDRSGDLVSICGNINKLKGQTYDEWLNEFLDEYIANLYFRYVLIGKNKKEDLIDKIALVRIVEERVVESNKEPVKIHNVNFEDNLDVIDEECVGDFDYTSILAEGE